MDGEFRYERREKKLESKRKRMKKHGRNIATIYKNALTKTRGKKSLQRFEKEVQEY